MSSIRLVLLVTLTKPIDLSSFDGESSQYVVILPIKEIEFVLLVVVVVVVVNVNVNVIGCACPSKDRRRSFVPSSNRNAVGRSSLGTFDPLTWYRPVLTRPYRRLGYLKVRLRGRHHRLEQEERLECG